MSIMLGNLSLQEMEQRTGIEFPQELKNLLENTREQNCDKVKGRRVWHCYDLPFNLEVGDMEFAKEIYALLKPFNSEFKQQMQIGVDQ